MSAAAAQLEQAARGLRRRSAAHVPVPSYEESVGADSYHSAAHNPALVPLDIAFAGGRARARVVLDAAHEGPRDNVPGGVISYLMDTLLACLVQQQGRLCVTASLTVVFRARTPLRVPLDLEARVSEKRSRSLLVVGSIAHADQVTVEARGLFVVVPAR